MMNRKNILGFLALLVFSHGAMAQEKYQSEERIDCQVLSIDADRGSIQDKSVVLYCPSLVKNKPLSFQNLKELDHFLDQLKSELISADAEEEKQRAGRVETKIRHTLFEHGIVRLQNPKIRGYTEIISESPLDETDSRKKNTIIKEGFFGTNYNSKEKEKQTYADFVREAYADAWDLGLYKNPKFNFPLKLILTLSLHDLQYYAPYSTFLDTYRLTKSDKQALQFMWLDRSSEESLKASPSCSKLYALGKAEAMIRLSSRSNDIPGVYKTGKTYLELDDPALSEFDERFENLFSHVVGQYSEGQELLETIRKERQASIDLSDDIKACYDHGRVDVAVAAYLNARNEVDTYVHDYVLREATQILSDSDPTITQEEYFDRINRFKKQPTQRP